MILRRADWASARREEEKPVGQTSRQRRYSLEELARRGDEIYEREVLPHLDPADEGKYALIDIETADYEIDRDEIAASDRLLARHPDAQVWMRQIGSPYARRIGPRFKTAGLTV
jgi:hypothetical protein